MPDRRASEPSRALTGASIVLLLAGLAGCAPAGSTATTPRVATSPTPAAPATGAPSLATSPTPVATPLATSRPRPPGTLAWPTAFDVELQPGTYFSSPPFDVPFTIGVGEPGWFSGHLHAEFFDLLRFDGIAHGELPNRMLAFGVPETFRSRSGDVPVAGLSPAEAVDLLEDGYYLTTSNRAPLELLGLRGVVVDLHSEVHNTPVFGGQAGNFGLSPDRDARLAALAHDGGFLVVAVLAEASDLDQAWDQAAGLLDTVDLSP